MGERHGIARKLYCVEGHVLSSNRTTALPKEGRVILWKRSIGPFEDHLTTRITDNT